MYSSGGSPSSLSEIEGFSLPTFPDDETSISELTFPDVKTPSPLLNTSNFETPLQPYIDEEVETSISELTFPDVKTPSPLLSTSNVETPLQPFDTTNIDSALPANRISPTFQAIFYDLKEASFFDTPSTDYWKAFDYIVKHLSPKLPDLGEVTFAKSPDSGLNSLFVPALEDPTKRMRSPVSNDSSPLSKKTTNSKAERTAEFLNSSDTSKDSDNVDEVPIFSSPAEPRGPSKLPGLSPKTNDASNLLSVFDDIDNYATYRQKYAQILRRKDRSTQKLNLHFGPRDIEYWAVLIKRLNNYQELIGDWPQLLASKNFDKLLARLYIFSGTVEREYDEAIQKLPTYQNMIVPIVTGTAQTVEVTLNDHLTFIEKFVGDPPIRIGDMKLLLAMAGLRKTDNRYINQNQISEVVDIAYKRVPDFTVKKAWLLYDPTYDDSGNIVGLPDNYEVKNFGILSVVSEKDFTLAVNLYETFRALKPEDFMTRRSAPRGDRPAKDNLLSWLKSDRGSMYKKGSQNTEIQKKFKLIKEVIPKTNIPESLRPLFRLLELRADYKPERQRGKDYGLRMKEVFVDFITTISLTDRNFMEAFLKTNVGGTTVGKLLEEVAKMIYPRGTSKTYPKWIEEDWLAILTAHYFIAKVENDDSRAQTFYRAMLKHMYRIFPELRALGNGTQGVYYHSNNGQDTTSEGVVHM
jgi:hypothetical protein